MLLFGCKHIVNMLYSCCFNVVYVVFFVVIMLYSCCKDDCIDVV